MHALENDGFLYIEGVDVDFGKLYEACQWFFALDESEKMKVARQPYNPKSKNFYRGYFPVIEGMCFCIRMCMLSGVHRCVHVYSTVYMYVYMYDT